MCTDIPLGRTITLEAGLAGRPGLLGVGVEMGPVLAATKNQEFL